MSVPDGPADGTSDEFLRGPKWRTRTTAPRRHRMAAVTFVIVVAIGVVVMAAAMWLLDRVGAPTWVVLLPWSIPTVVAVITNLTRPRVAAVTDDDDDSWPGYSIRWAMAGEIEPRSAPARVVTAVLFGAPLAWATLVSGVLTIVGFD